MKQNSFKAKTVFLKYLLLLFLTLNLYANEEPSATEIIQKVDANMRGKTIYMKMKITVETPSHKREMIMQTWGEGKKKSFVKTLYPPKDKGITFLSLDNQMWQYVPKIERIIKIPASMMLQNWMGTDITNDDIVKQSSLVDDYDAKVLLRKGSFVTLELTPKRDAAVVWGKILSRIDTNTYTSSEDIFYDEDGSEVRRFIYEDVKKVGKYYTPTIYKIIPSDKEGYATQIEILDVVYDDSISEKYFQKSALKRFSR